MDLLPFTTFWVTLSISQLASLWKAVAQVSALTNRVVWQAGCCTGCYSNWRKHVVVGSCVAIVHSEHTVKQDSTERYSNSTSRFRLKSKCRTVRSIKATESSCFFFLGTVWSSCEAWAAIHRPWRACDIFSVCDRVFRPAVSPRIWRWMSAAWWTRWGRRSCNWCKKELASSAVSG